MQTQQYEQEAHARGVEAAKAAANWIIDGNTKREFIPAVLAMFDDGDPQVSDYLPARPDLSGEYSDDPTPLSLYEDVTGRDGTEDDGLSYETEHGWLIDMLADAFERGVSETFEVECERILRAALAA